MCPRVLALVAVLALAVTGCVAPGASSEAESPAGLQQPTFTPLATGSDAATPATTGPADVGAAPTAATTVPSPSSAATSTSMPTSSGTASPPPDPSSQARATTQPPDGATGGPTVRGTLPDGTGDMRGLAAVRAPEHADLRELALEVGATTARIRVAFAGPAPETGDGDAILNVATYHDVTGDGQIDYEIWASLTSDGWGTSWFDMREGTARFAAEDDVEVEVVDGVVVLTFPPGHLGGARSGRWLASSEWGSAVDMGAGASAKDDAPDERTGQPWPS